MERDDEERPNAFPSFRLWTCGTFRAERLVEASGTYEIIRTAEWGGSSYPRLLLKVLLCCPGRRARREALVEMLWPETDPEQATQYINIATTKLRKVLELRKGHGSLLLTEDDYKHYLLQGQQSLWVDVDDALALLKEAESMGRTSHEALVRLEKAAQCFNQGTFLDGEEGLWVAGKRATLERVRYRCRLWLAEAYEPQGMPGQAEMVITTLVEEDPLDEDALCRLMELLHRQGMTHKALRLYEQSVQRFDEELGTELNPSTIALANRMREQQVEYIKNSPVTMNVLQTNTALVQQSRQTDNATNTLPIIHSASEVIASHEVNITINRREASKKIAALGVSLFTTPNVFGLIHIDPLLHDEEILSICSVSLPILWRLFFDGQLSEVQLVLPNYISRLALLTREPSTYQQQAADLESKAHQLACMLLLQEQDYGTALLHVDQALQCADIADDVNLKVASLIRKALVYRYIHLHLRKYPYHMLAVYQEAAQYASFVSPLLQGRVYTGLAEAHSQMKQEYEARHALEIAYKIFPEQPQNDPNFSSTHFKLPEKFEAIMYLNLQQARNAWIHLEGVDHVVPMTVVPDRIELSLDQAKASLLLEDLEQCCKYLEFAATSATTFGSHLRTREAHSIYRQIPIKWSDEQHVKALADYFHS